jgi:hypothetical protein
MTKAMGGIAVALVLALGMSGCEWSSGGGSSWNSAYNWVNFSGVYRGSNGGVLITDYSTSPASPESTKNASEQVATGNGVGTTVYSGSLDNTPVVAGSVTITGGGYVFNDNGDGSLSGNGGASGSIEYGTGAWSIDLNGGTINNGADIDATYQYTVGGTEATVEAGTSGIRIYAFTVFHEGETLRLTDNYGREYSGGFGSIRSTGGSEATPTEEPTPAAGEEVIAQFTAEGVSPAGYNIRMVGTFQGTYNAGALQSRSLNGTWIEDGGKTGDINGSASPIAVTQ